MTDHDTYYAAAQSWADERIDAERRMRRFAWTIAVIATAVATILAITVAMLVPLHTVQPYVVTVDRQSGAVELTSTIAGGKLTQNEAVIQAQLANYVRTRETFDATDLAPDYRRVQLLSAPDVRAAYVAAMATSNPASPLRTLARGDTVAIRIKSVSLLAPGTALVRFDADRSSGGRTISMTSYVSAISFGFSNAPLRVAERFDNPLGFAVTRYRRDVDGMPQ